MRPLAIPAAYYNEHDPFAAEWLRNLIAAGHIAPGEVDTRSIADVDPVDLVGFRQVHLFAGIGGWSLALRLAGWPDDRPVWTGSCPCQPFSAAGKGAAFEDERHLWPEMARLVAAARPAAVMGEQVDAAVRWGWLDLVFADLERGGYTCRAADIPAAGVGAPHIRQRLWWRADRLADMRGEGSQGRIGMPVGADQCAARPTGLAGGVADADGRDARAERQQRGGEQRQQPEDGGPLHIDRPGPTNGFWRDADWLGCRDAKWRPVEPGSFPLADGLPGRVGRLRAYGNAIVPAVAAAFIAATEAAA